MAMKLYWFPGSPFAWTVMLAMEHKGLSYELKQVNLSAGEQHSADYLTLNPRGKVPVLVDGDLVITESLAILAYLEAKQPEPSLFGQTAVMKARVMEALGQLLTYLEPAGMPIPATVFWQPWDDAARQTLRNAVANVLPEVQRIEALLTQQNALAGADISVADFRLYPIMSIFWMATSVAARKKGEGVPELAQLNRAGFPAIDHWCRRIEALPYYDKTLPPGWRKP